VTDAKTRLDSQALNPLRNLGLPLTPISLRTTPERIVGHYSVGNLPLAGAAALPPLAPAGSLASVQLHQSAINNVLKRLELGGREYPLKDLCHQLCTALSLPRADKIDCIPESITLRFANEQPLRVDFRQGQAHLVARLASFRMGEQQWHDLTIRCAYQFDDRSHLPVLQRVGQVKVESRQLGLMDRMILDGVFAGLLAGAERIPVLPAELASHPGLSQVAATQRHLGHGWLALAVGPQPPRDSLADAAKRHPH
jgi:hypothetical protein